MVNWKGLGRKWLFNGGIIIISDCNNKNYENLDDMASDPEDI
jgi:hypothetical protein